MKKTINGLIAVYKNRFLCLILIYLGIAVNAQTQNKQNDIRVEEKLKSISDYYDSYNTFTNNSDLAFSKLRDILISQGVEDKKIVKIFKGIERDGGNKFTGLDKEILFNKKFVYHIFQKYIDEQKLVEISKIIKSQRDKSNRAFVALDWNFSQLQSNCKIGKEFYNATDYIKFMLYRKQL